MLLHDHLLTVMDLSFVLCCHTTIRAAHDWLQKSMQQLSCRRQMDWMTSVLPDWPDMLALSIIGGRYQLMVQTPHVCLSPTLLL